MSIDTIVDERVAEIARPLIREEVRAVVSEIVGEGMNEVRQMLRDAMNPRKMVSFAEAGEVVGNNRAVSDMPPLGDSHSAGASPCLVC